MGIIVIFLLIAAFYILALRCRSGHPLLADLRRWRYAHRGLHGNGVPENSMAAFRLARNKGYGIELDVHLLKDGTLAVIHDSALLRTTGAPGRVEDLTAGDLENYRLEGTEETIPTFGQVLALMNCKAPMIIELKAEGGNHDALAQAVCDALEGYRGLYCIESFDPRCILWLRKNRPHVVRGQLSQNFLKDKTSGLSLPLRLVLTNLLTNFLTRPDFIAYKFEDRKGLSPRMCKEFWRAQPVSWTLRRPEDLNTALQEESIPIFENFEP